MPKLTIVCAGKMKESYQKEAINEYLKRLSKYFTCAIEEVPDIKIKDDASLKEEELVIKKEDIANACLLKFWLRGQDSNLRPSGYEPDELPTAPPRDVNLVPKTGIEPVREVSPAGF